MNKEVPQDKILTPIEWFDKEYDDTQNHPWMYAALQEYAEYYHKAMSSQKPSVNVMEAIEKEYPEPKNSLFTQSPIPYQIAMLKGYNLAMSSKENGINWEKAEVLLTKHLEECETDDLYADKIIDFLREHLTQGDGWRDEDMLAFAQLAITDTKSDSFKDLLDSYKKNKATA